MSHVDVSRLSGQFVLAPLHVREVDLWITIAHDHVSKILVNVQILTMHYLQSNTETDVDDVED
jgi:hypothetical protein